MSTQESRVREVIGSRHSPDYVDHLEIKFGEDWVGKPAVWITVIVKDDRLESTAGRDEAISFGNELSDAVIQSDLNLWPYVHFESMEEHAHMAEPA